LVEGGDLVGDNYDTALNSSNGPDDEKPGESKVEDHKKRQGELTRQSASLQESMISKINAGEKANASDIKQIFDAIRDQSE